MFLLAFASLPTVAGARWTIQDQRVPVPDAPVQKDKEKLIRELFKADYGKADKRALAQKLLQQGMGTNDDAASKYVLLREARETAVVAGDVDVAAKAVQEMTRCFVIDGVAEKSSTYDRLERGIKTPEMAKALAERYLRLVDEAISADKYDVAQKAADKAGSAARKSQDVSLAMLAKERASAVQDIEREANSAKAAMKVLEQSPQDPAANATVGRFNAFFKGDTAAGFAMLAISSDAVLKSLAEKELNPPTDGNEQLALGDRYWDLAEKEKGSIGPALKQRAILWYKKGAPTATGLTKTRMEARVDAYEQVRNAANPNLLNLVPLLDLKKDVMFGTWKLENGALTSSNSTNEVIEFPYTPPDEYDYRVVFTKLEGTGSISIILFRAGIKFNLEMGNGGWYGFAWWEKNTSSVNKTALQNGRRYTAVVQVRRDRLRLLIDDAVFIDYRTDWSEIKGLQQQSILRRNVVGLRTYECPVTFHRAELIEVSGKGKRVP